MARRSGALLPKGGHVVVSRDTSRAARMVKRAMVAGLNSAGINVRDLRVASRRSAASRRRRRAASAASTSARLPATRSRSRSTSSTSTGSTSRPAEQKKVERLYFRGEFRRAFFDEVGEIIYPPRALEYYAAGLAEAMGRRGFEGGWRKVVADMAGGAASIVLPQVAAGWHINLIGLNAFIDAEAVRRHAGSRRPSRSSCCAAPVELFHADFGVRFDPGAERVRLVAPDGALLDGDTALHAVIELWCRTRATSRARSPCRCRRRVSSTGSPGARARGHAAGAFAPGARAGRARRAGGFAGSTTGGYIFGDFFAAYDGVLPLA